MSSKIKLLAVLLVVALMASFCVGPVSAANEEIATSITLQTKVRDQRPDAYMFQSQSYGLIQGMVNPILGDDNTPVLNASGWYGCTTEDENIATAAPDTSKDYSAVEDFAFNSAGFHRWYHDYSQDPIAEIMANAQAVLANSADPNEKLYAICFARYAVNLASDDCLNDYDAFVEIEGKKVYPATEICNEIDNMLTLLTNAAAGSVSLGEFATDEIINDFNTIYNEYDGTSDLDVFFAEQLAAIDLSLCKDVRVNTTIKKDLVLQSDGELHTFKDNTMGYIYTYDSAVTPLGLSVNETGYFPIDGEGFGSFNDGTIQDGNNYHFTMEFENNFVYHGGEVFTFSGDDDVWVYINNQLVLDIGGIHSSLTGVIELDALAEKMGFKVGDVCKLNFFFAERMTTGSNLKISTSIQFVPEDYVYVVVNPETGVTDILPVVATVAAVSILCTVLLTVASKKRKQRNK